MLRQAWDQALKATLKIRIDKRPGRFPLLFRWLGRRAKAAAPALALGLIAGLPAGSPALALDGPVFGFSQVTERAQALAAEPFESLHGQVPEVLLNLNYDQWRDIRFKPAKALWRDEGLPFEAQFFHLGLYYDVPVKINIVDHSGVRPVKYSPDMFDYNRNNFSQPLPADLGFAGFRLHYPLKTPEYKDEVAVFLGASYLRGVGQKHHYGLSARGLAVDTAAVRGEEFPYFREFWLVKPAPGEAKITIYALLDSPSTAGAYEYQLIPGEETVMEVRSVLIQRHQVTTMGIAPLTSMFLYGENFNAHLNNDFRPEIHDSDGLLIHFGTGERLWRPLSNARERVQVNSFVTEHLAGFGLMQRDANFDHYQDLEAHYQSRPSAFITPKGDWGPGEVRLIQIPSDQEINDNIVAFWSPRTQPKAQVPVSYDYTINWTTAVSPQESEQGLVSATRLTSGTVEGALKFVVDFEGGNLNAYGPGADLAAQVTVPESVDLLEQQLVKNSVTGGWRLVFQVRPKSGGALSRLLGTSQKPLAELRAFLSAGGQVLTETWSYGADF